MGGDVVGMFDKVRYEMKCPVCGELLDDFQSKDGNCLLDTISPNKVDHFYTSCDECDSWIQLDRVIIKTKKFVMRVEKSDAEPNEYGGYGKTVAPEYGKTVVIK